MTLSVGWDYTSEKEIENNISVMHDKHNNISDLGIDDTEIVLTYNYTHLKVFEVIDLAVLSRDASDKTSPT